MQPTNGVRLDRERLNLELARRNSDGATLARVAGISAVTLSKARTGKAISAGTLAKIAVALTRLPVLPGVDDLVLPRQEKGPGLTARAQGGQGDARTDPRN